MGSFPEVAGGPGSRRRPGGCRSLLLLVSAATSSACGPRIVSWNRLPHIRRSPADPRLRGTICPPVVGAGTVRFTTRDLPASVGVEPAGLGVEDALASSAPPPAAPEAEQHHGADQRARCRQCGHDRLPSRALLVSTHDNSRCGVQSRIGNVLRDRELRSPADDWGLPSVIRRKTQFS